MNTPRARSASAMLPAVGAGVLIMVCCAGPALLAGGALSGLGSLLRESWLVLLGALLAAAAAGYAIARHARGERARAGERCQPAERAPAGGGIDVDRRVGS